MKAQAVFEDDEFVILHSRDYVVVRKNCEYSFHSHFDKFSGAKGLISLFYKKEQPINPYFTVAMQRITTEREFDSFKQAKKKKQLYFNANKGVRRK